MSVLDIQHENLSDRQLELTVDLILPNSIQCMGA